MKKVILFGLFFVLFSTSLLAQTEDVAGSEDHPMLTRYPGSVITFYETHKFKSYNLAKGPITGYRYIEDTETIEGQLTRITYEIEKSVDVLSLDEVYRDYALAVDKAEISVIAKGVFPERNVGKEVGGSLWIGVALKDNGFGMKASANKLFAGTSSSGGTFSIIGNVSRPEGMTYVAMYGERHSNDLVLVHVDFIEVKAAETGKVVASADYIKREIEDKGSVKIYGINFDFDKSDIKAESKPVIEEIAKFLQSNPDISLYVVGHTDMKGTFDYNLKLSKERAGAVVKALVDDHEIDSGRLTPDGVAFLSPVATNQTDTGRALNRRTELVLRASN